MLFNWENKPGGRGRNGGRVLPTDRNPAPTEGGWGGAVSDSARQKKAERMGTERGPRVYLPRQAWRRSLPLWGGGHGTTVVLMNVKGGGGLPLMLSSAPTGCQEQGRLKSMADLAAAVAPAQESGARTRPRDGAHTGNRGALKRGPDTLEQRTPLEDTTDGFRATYTAQIIQTSRLQETSAPPSNHVRSQ